MHSPTPAAIPYFRPTTHACLRYAQRVLGLPIELHDLLGNRALHGRCERGVGRLLARAHFVGSAEGADWWVVGTRGLLVKNGHVLTVLVAPPRRGCRPRAFRAPVRTAA